MMWTLLATLGTPAFGCGGLFCNVAQPVIQNAERIVFDIDEETKTVETHVQISYEGPSEQFAWVVPVAKQPELFLSTQTLFDTLVTQTAPLFNLNIIEEGECTFGRNRGVALDSAEDASSSAPPASPGNGGVKVVDQGQVGPFETVTLLAQSSEALLQFLQENSYDLPDDLQPVLDPYIADEAYFVALKLRKDRDVGDIAPLGMRYEGDEASIPIQLTSIATADDLRLEVYVFAERRVVPRTYLHVRINEAAIDWWNFGQNYPDVITQAADEAGGQAFATDYFGAPTAGYEVNPIIESELLASPSGLEWVFTAAFQTGVQVNNEMANAIATAIDLPDAIDPIDFVGCPDCFEGWDSGPDFDREGATAYFMEAVVEPLRDSQDLFEGRRLTRMTSSLSANEMTVDPVFTQNADMDDESNFVSNVHNADLVYECRGGKRRDKAERRLELSDGRVIFLPSEQWIADNETTELEMIEELGATKAQVIERTSSSGQPEVLFDFTSDLFDLTNQHNSSIRGLLSGCGGCQANGGGTAPAAALLLALGLVGLRRRDR
ncbi:MAG: DUF2330 domain-containing protein [Myxococcota bacterium]